MQNSVIIIGAGGHAKVIADIVLKSGDRVIGFLDDSRTGEIWGIPILGSLSDISKYCDVCSFIIGIGNNETRKKLAEENFLQWHTAIHPSAIIAEDVMLGVGTVIMAGVIINPSTTIGDHCIINTGAIVEHDNEIDDYVHISPNATLCGTVSVGELSHIGSGAVIKNNTDICAGCVIGAGAVVVKSIRKPGTYIGIPAEGI